MLYNKSASLTIPKTTGNTEKNTDPQRRPDRMNRQMNCQIVLVPPPAETLPTAGSKDSFWPKSLANDDSFIAQATLRQNILKNLNLLFKELPLATTEVTAAVDAGKATSEVVAELYELLAIFFESDPQHKRLILYLPFELLPPKAWSPRSPACAKAKDQFIAAYLKRWHELLEENDVRANFVDGNILEKELSPNGQPKVKKAAHLIPLLLKKGYISEAEVQALADNNADEILKDSITDALSLITIAVPPQIKKVVTSKQARAWLSELGNELAFEIKKIEIREALDTSRNLPKARVAWERLDREDSLVTKFALHLTERLTDSSLVPEDLKKFLAINKEKVSCLVALRGIGQALEETWKVSSAEAIKMAAEYEMAFYAIWTSDLPSAKDELSSILSRLAHLNVLTENQLAKFDVRKPELATSYPTSVIQAELGDFITPIKTLSSDPELSRFIYPVVLFFGSRLKGYAKSNADLDAAMFVRPGVPFGERPQIQKRLREIFPSKKIDGKIVEFWLTEENDRLKIKDFPDPDMLLAENAWAHLIFASVWLGEADAIHELYQKLMLGFLNSAGVLIEGHAAREVWLYGMEHEVLQYRLIHKGYKRIYPNLGGIPKAATRLDPQSTFWDSGYRRLATKLYMARMFLPQLQK
jgi:hypothetical protein